MILKSPSFCRNSDSSAWLIGGIGERGGGEKATHFLPSFPLSFCEHRAVDNQVYVATVSPARDEKASYIAWGHSTVVNPW